ncbi:Fc.00g098470.m01.CDS01 [Cosmosporella sp. VM-42]
MANSAIPKFIKRVSETNQTSSSIDESFEETQSAPALSRKEHSDDYGHPSKFVEAMKNPNWRQRSEDSGPYASTSTELSYYEVKNPERSKGVQASSSTNYLSSHGNVRSPNFCDHIAADAAAAHWRSGRGSYDTAKEYSQASSSAMLRSCSSLSGETEFHVLSHLNLPGFKSQGKPVSVFEVTPASAGGPSSAQKDERQDASPSSLIQVQRIKDDIRSPARIYEAMAMRIMPRKSPTAMVWGQIASEGARHSTSRLEQARKAVIEDPAVARIGDCHRVTQPKNGRNERYSFSNTFSDEGEAVCMSNQHTKKEDVGFQKLLHKLKKKSDQEASCRQGQQRSAPVQTNGFAWEHDRRKCEERREQRKLTSRDSALGSLDEKSGVHSKETSGDSGIFLDSKDQLVSLNPRAREFLSLNTPVFPATEQGVTSQFAGKGVSGIFRRRDSDSSVCFTPSQSSERSEAPCEPYPIIGGSTLPRLNRSLLPPNSLGSLPVAGLTAPGLPPPGLPLPPPLTALSFPMAPFTNGPMQALGCGPHPMADSAGPMPPMAFVPSPTAAPFTPVGVPGVVNVRVKPVPKPRIPDSFSQQNYEAWLEFRKATEPGYALACKQRQQFRAQRRPQDFPGPGANIRAETAIKAE